MSHRTQITLSDDQYALLRAEASRHGLGLAELIRRAVDRTYGTVDRGTQLSALEASFGCWPDSDDGATYVESLRPGLARRLERTPG
jgi:hypothetical protein